MSTSISCQVFSWHFSSHEKELMSTSFSFSVIPLPILQRSLKEKEQSGNNSHNHILKFLKIIFRWSHDKPKFHICRVKSVTRFEKKNKAIAAGNQRLLTFYVHTSWVPVLEQDITMYEMSPSWPRSLVPFHSHSLTPPLTKPLTHSRNHSLNH